MSDRETATATRDFNDPIEAIKFYMAERGLKRRDLVPMIGSRSKVSEILSRHPVIDNADGTGTLPASGDTGRSFAERAGRSRRSL